MLQKLFCCFLAAIYQKTRKHQSLQTAANKKLNDNPGKSARDVCRVPRDGPKNGFAKIQVPPKEDDIQTMMDIIETDTDDVRNNLKINKISINNFLLKIKYH